MTTAHDIINLQNLAFRRGDKTILADINWTIASGQHWGLLGLNGSGKSSLLNILNGSHFPSSGQVTVLGQPFSKTSIPDLQKRIGLVSSWLNQQLPTHLSVENTIISGKFASIGIYQHITDEGRAQAGALLADFNMTHLSGRNLASLSQGERQTVLILRALMTDPELLILDEPMGGLDLFARERLLDNLALLAERKPQLSQLMVTHQTEEIPAFYQKVLLLKAGHIFAQGDRDQILTPERLHAFYDKPVILRPFKNGRIQVVPE